MEDNSEKLISFWSSGESVEDSNAGYPGGSITKETSAKEGRSDEESTSSLL